MKTHDEVDRIEDRLRKMKASLEAIAREVCGDPNGGKVYEALRYAVTDVGDAIRESFMMRPDGDWHGTEMSSVLNKMAAQDLGAPAWTDSVEAACEKYERERAS